MDWLKACVGVCAVLLAACDDAAPDLSPESADIPPAPADATVAPSGNVETFAIDAIYLGDTDRLGGPPSADAWMSYGYDLDHRRTTISSKDTCTNDAGGVQIDGHLGIDNNFGQYFMSDPADGPSYFPIFPTSEEVSLIRDGAFTLQLQFGGLPSDGTDAIGISMHAFVSGPFGTGAPAFDTTTNWPVLASSFTDGGTFEGGALFQRADGYVTNGVFVSGTAQDEPLQVPVLLPIILDLVPTTVRVHYATVTFKRVGDSLREGVIAGVLDPKELTAAAQTLFSSCKSPLPIDFAYAADSLNDGSNAPNVPCTRISIGLGFTARKVGDPTIVATTPTACADAGLQDAPSD